MRLPNGYGSVTKLSGSRRKPYMARICDGSIYDDKLKDFKPNRVVLGYYTTRKDALAALAEYNSNPFKIENNALSFKQVYEIWKKKNYENLSDSTITSRESALKYCEPIFDKKVREINVAMLQEIIDTCPHGSSTKKNIRTIMNNVFEYADQNNIISKNPAQFIKIGYSEPVIDRIPFSDAEIKILWGNKDKWDYKILLILLYSGMRVNELLKNYRENVNLEERWIYVPDELAKNKESVRYVPIHNKTYDLVKWFYDNSMKHGKEKLILNENGTLITYNNFVARNLKKINEKMEVAHKMHDTRHTFASNAHKYKLDELKIQKIMGHSPDNILKKVYTHITQEELLIEINKIK